MGNGLYVTQVTARRHCGSDGRPPSLTRGPPEQILLGQRPAQQLSGEGTHGFTQFSGLAGMMLVGAGSVPACCQGNKTREGWCAGALSQLRRAAWDVCRPVRAAIDAPAMQLPWHQLLDLVTDDVNTRSPPAPAARRVSCSGSIVVQRDRDRVSGQRQ